MGHEDQFRPPSLSGGCRLGKETFAEMGVKEEDAPSAVIPVLDLGRQRYQTLALSEQKVGVGYDVDVRLLRAADEITRGRMARD